MTFDFCRVTEKKVKENFHLPLTEVAKKFGMCSTAFKKLCRKHGVMQWPYRTLRSLEKKMASLRAEQKFTNDNNSIEEQIAKLQAKREQILAGGGGGGGTIVGPEDEAAQHTPSDDSSTRQESMRSSNKLPSSVYQRWQELKWGALTTVYSGRHAVCARSGVRSRLGSFLVLCSVHSGPVIRGLLQFARKI